VPAERLANSPHLTNESSAAQLVQAFKLEAEQLPSSRLIAPQLFSADPVEATRLLKSDPSFISIMLKGLASRVFTPERLTLEQATKYIKEIRPGMVSLPLLEELNELEQTAKKQKVGPQRPTEQQSNIG